MVMDEEVAPVVKGPEPQTSGERTGSMVKAVEAAESIAAEETGTIEEVGRPSAPDELDDEGDTAEGVPCTTMSGAELEAITRAPAYVK